MTCEEFRELMGDHLGDELVMEIREEFETHRTGCTSCGVFLETRCTSCGVFLETYTYTVKITRTLPRCSALPPAVEARLRERCKDFLGKKDLGKKE
jgi:hypothetical protein